MFLNNHRSSIKVIYLKSGKQGPNPNPIWNEKFSNIFYISKTLSSCSSLNIGCVSEKLIYLESGKHNLQHGSEIFCFLSFVTFHFRHDWLLPTWQLCMLYGNSQNQKWREASQTLYPYSSKKLLIVLLIYSKLR